MGRGAFLGSGNEEEEEEECSGRGDVCRRRRKRLQVEGHIVDSAFPTPLVRFSSEERAACERNLLPKLE